MKFLALVLILPLAVSFESFFFKKFLKFKFSKIKVSGETKKCLQEFYEFQPATYCEFPYIDLTWKDEQSCIRTCHESIDTCCVLNCIYKIMKIFENEKFISEAYLKCYKNHFDRTNRTDYDIWVPSIKTSMETCQELSKTSNDFQTKYF